MKTIISKTHSLVGDGKEGPETTPPNTAVEVSDKTASRLIARGTFSEYVEPKVKAKAAEKPTEPSGPVNVNEATVDELTPVDGLGQEKAEAIVAYREQHGPFKSIEKTDDDDGLTPISGIAAATAKKLADKLTV